MSYHNYLLITCIDETDTKDPGQWVSDEAGYDLIFLCYSKDQQFHEHLRAFGRPVLEVHSGKWKNLKWYFDHFEFEQYSYFWFPDPDLVCDVQIINDFFRYVDTFNLDLCQPGLTDDSFASHEFCKQVKCNIARKVPFVEIMCPCFSRKALKELLWTFDLSYSGYGLDILWAEYLQGYVVDLFSVRHPRPQQFASRARKKGFPEPNDELRNIINRFGLELEG